MASEFLSKVADFFVDKFFLEEGFFLVVESFFKDLDFGSKRLLICIFTFEFSLLWMLLRVFKLTREQLHLFSFSSELILQVNHCIGQPWHLRDVLLNHFKLSLSFLEFKIDHPNLFFLLANLLFTVLEDILLDVALLVENAQFVVLVDQLDTSVVTTLACNFIIVNQVVHFLLETVNDQVQLVSLVDLLTNNAHLLLVDELLFVEL